MFKIDEIWIDEDAEEFPLTRQILELLPESKPIFKEAVPSSEKTLLYNKDPLIYGKRILHLVKYKGAFVKPCPGTKEYVCCNLQILHIGQGCPMDCKYCALQIYFNRPVIEIPVNTEEMFDQLRAHLLKNGSKFHRFCTGEFADSLALDELTGFSKALIQIINGVSNASLELKTKTDNVSHLLNLKPKGNIVVSFSMNAEEIQRQIELKSTSLEFRLKAAQMVAAHGYKIGFHFDPIIPIPNWRQSYSRTLDKIARSIQPSEIAWISLGVIRFVPQLKDLALDRFGNVPFFHDGFVRGMDGKSRLGVDRRIEYYQVIANKIRTFAPQAKIYLCMESPHVWQEALGLKMESDDDLDRYLSDLFLG